MLPIETSPKPAPELAPIEIPLSESVIPNDPEFVPIDTTLSELLDKCASVPITTLFFVSSVLLVFVWFNPTVRPIYTSDVDLLEDVFTVPEPMYIVSLVSLTSYKELYPIAIFLFVLPV